MQVTIQSIPANLQEFETLAAGGRQPERICALFLCALALFVPQYRLECHGAHEQAIHQGL